MKTKHIYIKLEEDLGITRSDLEIDYGNTGALVTGFTNNGGGLYTLDISTPENTGPVKVRIKQQPGTTITPPERTVTVFKPPEPGTFQFLDLIPNEYDFEELTADGEDSEAVDNSGET